MSSMLQQTVKTLYNATIITMNDGFEVIEKGYLTIEGNNITALGKGLPENKTNLIDCSGKIIMPFAHDHVQGHCRRFAIKRMARRAHLACRSSTHP
jgi:predicted amidohydrolase YtcJ